MSVRNSLSVLAVLVIALPFIVFARLNRTSNDSAMMSVNDLQLYEVRRGKFMSIATIIFLLVRC